MPIYEYENDVGEIQELFRNISSRDDAPDGFKRREISTTAPATVGVAADPYTMVAGVRRGLKKLEHQRGGFGDGGLRHNDGTDHGMRDEFGGNAGLNKMWGAD